MPRTKKVAKSLVTGSRENSLRVNRRIEFCVCWGRKCGGNRSSGGAVKWWMVSWLDWKAKRLCEKQSYNLVSWHNGLIKKNPGGGEIFCTRPDRPWGTPSLLYNRYRVFPRGKAAGSVVDHPTLSSAEVKERVKLTSQFFSCNCYFFSCNCCVCSVLCILCTVCV